VVRFAIPASVPRRPLASPPTQQAILGGLLGLMIGIALAFLLELMDDKVRRREDVEQVVQLPLLGLVPRSPTHQNGAPIALADTAAPIVESARFLRDLLESHAQASQLILFTPVAPSSGASSLAAHVAIVTAQAGRQVILVDADIRTPKLHAWFGLPNDAGLANLTATPPPGLETILRPTAVPGLRLLTTGSAQRLSPDLLASPAMAAILADLRQHADLILIDAAAANTASDAVLLAEHADGVVLVVRSGKSTVTDIQHVREAVEMVEGRVLGVVLNDVRRARSLRPAPAAANLASSSRAQRA
jgi:non-specific protein-tyrosine kinase